VPHNQALFDWLVEASRQPRELAPAAQSG
jgi:hypothetical protein